uniref:Uncharacterized protein n=1 Tax=Candidatus Kentrum sp. DK TaxID=2126562 RepID=A0A450S0I4_9GAMM|nr:MAG: hypothetical protein BECKDK2373C_GA0170839_10105 [Candidatus Kentron sp. DK]VFJ52579.1 MAG: hypothetical protein BECKDK2373B_GA0170837_10399 [Candidatus Kentron sp. DK]
MMARDKSVNKVALLPAIKARPRRRREMRY